ncbi:MAG: hypothetical protein V2A73_03940 [Pseudomonadota bacterium]
MAKEKEPGMDIEEAKARLRLEEIEREVASCPACTAIRQESRDPTAYCETHLRRVYGL